jgi:hypothetical protein
MLLSLLAFVPVVVRRLMTELAAASRKITTSVCATSARPPSVGSARP